LTEPELGEGVRDHLARMRFAARCEVEREDHESYVVIGEGAAAPPNGVAIACDDFGVPALEVLDTTPPDAPQLDDQELERLRIEAGTPRFGREIDDRVLPAEAGLEERAVSFTKGCYPGQEPVARQHYRGKVNRRLRVLEVDGGAADRETPVVYDGKNVGRVTSSVEGLAL